MSEPKAIQPNRGGTEHSLDRWEDPRPPVVIVERSQGGRDLLDSALRMLGGLALLLIVVSAAMLLLTQAFSGVGSGLGGVGGVVERATESVQRAAQQLADRMDPAHPPRGGLLYDTEFDDFKRAAVGETLGRTSEYILALAEIKKREGASTSNEAQYAVVRRRFETPRETRIFGQVVRTDRGEADYYLYKGESFRLGTAYYKVNWVSVERGEIAITRYRNADDLTVALKFQLD